MTIERRALLASVLAGAAPAAMMANPDLLRRALVLEAAAAAPEYDAVPLRAGAGYPTLALANAAASRGEVAQDSVITVEGFTRPGDGGGFAGVVGSHAVPGNPGGGRVHPLPPYNVRMWGALGDGETDDFAACQAAANACSFVSSQSSGKQWGVAGQNLIFPHGIYNFGDRRVVMPNQVDPVTGPGGNVVIKHGSFFWETTYGNHIAGFQFVDPPVRRGKVAHIANTAPVTVTAPGHGFAEGDFVRFRGVNGMTEINGRGFVAVNVQTDGFTLMDSDGGAWSTYTGGGMMHSGAALEFDTNNVSRSTFTVDRCSCFGQDGGGYAFVCARNYGAARSTAVTLRDCVAGSIDRILHAPCDSVRVDGGFYWQGTSQEAAFYSRGMTNVDGVVMVPRHADPGSHWWDWDVMREPYGANQWTARGCRFSGEKGGITALRVLANAGDLGQHLNPDGVAFENCYIAARRGGVADNSGGVVVLGREGDRLATPNTIRFHGCGVNLMNSYFVRGEIDIPIRHRKSYNFLISIDEATRQTLERNNQVHPVSAPLLPYLDRTTRATLTGRSQVARGRNVATPDILRGAVIELAGVPYGRVVERIVNAKPGDRITLLSALGDDGGWRVVNGGSSGMRFHLRGGQDFTGEAGSVLNLVIDAAGDAREI